MKTIIINSPKYGIKDVLVDDEDYDDLVKHHWCVRKMPKTFYAVRFTCTNGKEGSVYMHRHILGLTNRRDWCDHGDHNGLNNQRRNIRKSTIAQNKQNKTGHGSSKYLGVCYVNTTRIRKNKTKEDVIFTEQYYKAAITINGKQIHLGNFKNEIEAAKARDIAAKKYHGEFANLNFKS